MRENNIYFSKVDMLIARKLVSKTIKRTTSIDYAYEAANQKYSLREKIGLAKDIYSQIIIHIHIGPSSTVHFPIVLHHEDSHIFIDYLYEVAIIKHMDNVNRKPQEPPNKNKKKHQHIHDKSYVHKSYIIPTLNQAQQLISQQSFTIEIFFFTKKMMKINLHIKATTSISTTNQQNRI